MGKGDSIRTPAAEDRVLNTIVERLVSLYRPERIYLFGSVARGDASPDSDYDLMVVVPDSTPQSLRDPGLAYRALWRLGAAIDPLVWTRTQFDSRLHLRASLPSTILREGRLLYAA
ncbi:MAG TPA: nucleotidyltransferase domain-containing protein [Bryobacteraceae bacterium]|jgi:predicted nucleotidyltransferase|nr:nucleotidyltransferase domain-containing protein [Bryobacteraceae bacterium]